MKDIAIAALALTGATSLIISFVYALFVLWKNRVYDAIIGTCIGFILCIFALLLYL